MRVAVVGAGGIGGLYGGLLARAGHEVVFLARGEHLRAIQQHGLEIRSADFGAFVVHGRSSDNPDDLGQAELVLFAVKTYDLDVAAPAARKLLAPEGQLLTFQNGLDAPDQVADVVGSQRVLIGTTGLETTILEPGVIGHLSKGHYVFVAALHGPPTPSVVKVVEMLSGAGINASVAEDGRRALWEKAWVLLPMASITSVCRAPIGPIRDLPETRRLIEALLDEVTAVARAYGYDLPEARERARSIIETWPLTGTASMARDFERGKRTELEALTGALVRMADARGVDVPVARTAYALLKLRQIVAAGSEAGARNERVAGLGDASDTAGRN
jgi:2-dehydropantoate 2-reductase